MCKASLAQQLKECLDGEIPVYGVVAIIGSTEHGACDSLTDILELRQVYEAQGLSFAIHCDAAWGGYFACMLRGEDDRDGELPFVPTLALQEHTKRQLLSLHEADSITVDPHK